MSDDDIGFLKAIHENPRDPLRRLIYADWLEEQSDNLSHARCRYLRLGCEIERTQPGVIQRELLTEFGKLNTTVGFNWRRFLDDAPVRFCLEFEFECSRGWHELALTNDDAVRHCGTCDERVHYARTTIEAVELARQRRCVAIDSIATEIATSKFRDRVRGTRHRMLLGKLQRPSE